MLLFSVFINIVWGAVDGLMAVLHATVRLTSGEEALEICSLSAPALATYNHGSSLSSEPGGTQC